jgi:hypothetical protein
MRPSDFAPASPRAEASAAARTARASQIAGAWTLLLLVDVVKTLGFWRLYRAIGWVPTSRRRSRKPAAVSAANVCDAIDAAAVHYFHRVLCLQSAAAAVCLLRFYGIPAALVIGVRRLPFEAHAWVEVEGQVVLNDRSGLSRYHTIARC